MKYNWRITFSYFRSTTQWFHICISCKIITKNSDSEGNSNTYWLALSVKLHRTMIITQSAICFYFTFSWRCHYLHRFRTNLSFSFGDLIKICNRNVTFKTKSHLIRYGRLTIKKQGLLWNIWKRCHEPFQKTLLVPALSWVESQPYG